MLQEREGTDNRRRFEEEKKMIRKRGKKHKSRLKNKDNLQALRSTTSDKKIYCTTIIRIGTCSIFICICLLCKDSLFSSSFSEKNNNFIFKSN